MQIKLAGSSIDIKGQHLIATFVLFLVIGVPATMLLLSSPTSGSTAATSAFYSIILAILSIIAHPLLAILLLFVAGVFKFKKDESTCRSMATSGFIIYGAALIVLLILSFVITPMEISANISGAIVGLLQTGVDAIMIYLWMLIFLKNDGKKIVSTIPYALIFSILVFVAGRLFLYGLAYHNGVPYVFNFDIASFSIIAVWFVDGTAILYRIKGQKLNMEAAYIYSALLIAGAIVYGAVDPTGAFLGNLSRFELLIEDIVALILLYLLSRMKQK